MRAGPSQAGLRPSRAEPGRAWAGASLRPNLMGTDFDQFEMGAWKIFFCLPVNYPKLLRKQQFVQ